MLKYLALFATAFVGALVWAVVTRLDAEALSLMVGLLLGVMSGIPTALLVLAAGRQREETEGPRHPWREIGPAATTLARNGHRQETVFLSGEMEGESGHPDA